MEDNIKLKRCPSDFQDKVKEMITYYWYVFYEDGFRRPIRGFSFQIDTGNHPPICGKPPRYIPHESEVMQNLVGQMDEKGVVDDNNGP